LFSPIDRFIIGPNILGHSLYKGPKIFFHNVDFTGIRRHRILRRFQKYKLTVPNNYVYIPFEELKFSAIMTGMLLLHKDVNIWE
jgi:hypothetical protein